MNQQQPRGSFVRTTLNSVLIGAELVQVFSFQTTDRFKFQTLIEVCCREKLSCLLTFCEQTLGC